MDNGTRPNDYIDLTEYPAARCVTHLIPEAIRRLYGQPFNRYQLTQILVAEYEVEETTGVEDTVRKCLYDMEKKGLIEIHSRSVGRGRLNSYIEKKRPSEEGHRFPREEVKG